MTRPFFIHGHFYQPPREDPWFGDILPEGSAAPARNWNERIARESYAPLAWARRTDDQGRVFEIVNCYEWISFNFGPTLLSWLERAEPDTYARILGADAASMDRLGSGNALAQVYHHVIMPLASDLDKRLQTRWAVTDFETRFGRKPEGMWLAESAVDTATLEVLADHDIRFTILAPRQAEAVAEEGGEWSPVDEGSLDISEPYAVALPSGRSMAVFFYHGPLSQAVAFERLLEDGGRFWSRIAEGHRGGVLSLATDGETYGHHFPFGEMALAHLISLAREGRDGMAMTNPGAVLRNRPPRRRVRLREPSSWSCVHGVERWRSNCGCTTGDTPNADQEWRRPLRTGLDDMKQGLDAYFFEAGAKVFKDPEDALLDFGRVLAGGCSRDSFGGDHFRARLSTADKRRAWRLLDMQQWGLAAFASCAWFFDEISRIEPVNAMTFGLRAMELCRLAGGPDLQPAFVETLGLARSNYAHKGDGADLFRNEVLPRLAGRAGVAAQALLQLRAGGELARSERTVEWPAVAVAARITSDKAGEGGEERTLTGTALVHHGQRDLGVEYGWRWTPRERDLLAAPIVLTPKGNGTKGPSGEVVTVHPAGLSWNRRQAVGLECARQAENAVWDALERTMRQGAGLFMERQIAQEVPQAEPSWEAVWPGLAWSLIAGQPGGPHHGDQGFLTDFIRRENRGAGGEALVRSRVTALLVELLRSDAPDWPRAASVAARAMDLRLEPYWWEVQNLLWTLNPDHEDGLRLAEAAGIVLPGRGR